jgi:hypothetical protein
MYRALRVNTKNLIRESCCEIGVFILLDSRYLWLTPGTCIYNAECDTMTLNHIATGNMWYISANNRK